MAFKSRKERYAYVKGIKKGMRGGKLCRRKKKPRNSYKNYKIPSPGVYNRYGRVDENRVDDRYGSVVFWDGDIPF